MWRNIGQILESFTTIIIIIKRIETIGTKGNAFINENVIQNEIDAPKRFVEFFYNFTNAVPQR